MTAACSLMPCRTFLCLPFENRNIFFITKLTFLTVEYLSEIVKISFGGLENFSDQRVQEMVDCLHHCWLDILEISFCTLSVRFNPVM